MHSIRIALALALSKRAFQFPDFPGHGRRSRSRRLDTALADRRRLDLAYRQELRAIEHPLDRRARRPGGQVERSGGERRLPAVVQPGDRAGSLHRRAAGGAKLPDVDPLGRGRAGLCPDLLRVDPLGTGHSPRSLAASVQVFARAEKGEYEQSLADLEALFKEPGCVAQTSAKSDAATALAVGEAYFCSAHPVAAATTSPASCASLACRRRCLGRPEGPLRRPEMARLDLLHKPAPGDLWHRRRWPPGIPWPISKRESRPGCSFRESWCSHCAGSMRPLNALAQEYHRQGFVILRVNLDAKHADVKDGNKQRWRPLCQCTDRHGVTLDRSARRPEDGQRAHGLWRGGGPGELPHRP